MDSLYEALPLLEGHGEIRALLMRAARTCNGHLPLLPTRSDGHLNFCCTRIASVSAALKILVAC